MSTHLASARTMQQRHAPNDAIPRPSKLSACAPAFQIGTRATAAVVELAGENTTVGYLIAPASTISPQLMTLMVKHTDGFICVAMCGPDLDRMGLPPMLDFNESIDGQDYTVAVDAAHGITTGISARDRACTVQMLAHPDTVASDLTRPGHVLPVRTSTEAIQHPQTPADAALAFVARSGRGRAAAFAAILDRRGDIAPHGELVELARVLGLPHVKAHLADSPETRGSLHMPSGAFRSYEYRSPVDGTVRVALTRVPRQ